MVVNDGKRGGEKQGGRAKQKRAFYIYIFIRTFLVRLIRGIRNVSAMATSINSVCLL